MDFPQFEIATFGMTKQDALRKNVCIKCRKTPEFTTELGVREYQISALCEKCFDEITKEPEEE